MASYDACIHHRTFLIIHGLWVIILLNLNYYLLLFVLLSLCSYFGRTNTYIKAVYELSNLINVRFRTFPYHNNLIFYLSPHGFRHRKASKVAHSHTGNNQTQKFRLQIAYMLCIVHVLHSDVRYIHIHNLVLWRASHKKKEGSAKGREGVGAHTG